MPNTRKQILECSSRGDRRFCSFYARITINGVKDSIEHFFQKSKRNKDGRASSSSGGKCDHFICPYTLKKFDASEIKYFYRGLWASYFKQNPELVKIAAGYDGFSDMFRDKNPPDFQQADIIALYVTNNAAFMADMQKSAWYQNLANHYAHKKTSAPINANLVSPSQPAESPAEKEKTDDVYRIPVDPYDVIQAKLCIGELIEFLEIGSVAPREIEEDLRKLATAVQHAMDNPNKSGFVRVHP